MPASKRFVCITPTKSPAMQPPTIAIVQSLIDPAYPVELRINLIERVEQPLDEMPLGLRPGAFVLPDDQRRRVLNPDPRAIAGGERLDPFEDDPLIVGRRQQRNGPAVLADRDDLDLDEIFRRFKRL